MLKRHAKEDAESAVSHYRGEILKPFCQRYWFSLIGNGDEASVT